MDIGILGTGNLAVALGEAWLSAGHSVRVTGRHQARAEEAAGRIGAGAQSVAPEDLAAASDVVVVAVSYEGLPSALALVGGPEGALSGSVVVDCTNAVDYATGRLEPATGSAAELVAAAAPGAHVVKAFHLFAGASWPYDGPPSDAPVVAMCGDDAAALDRVAALARDLGARAAVVGGLDAARQLEEAAAFVMRVAGAGHNPARAVPDIDPSLLGGAAQPAG